MRCGFESMHEKHLLVGMSFKTIDQKVGVVLHTIMDLLLYLNFNVRLFFFM